MRGKSIALLALALGCGVIAMLGVTEMMSRRGGDSSGSVETKTVFVAEKDIPLGTVVEKAMLKAEQWPKDTLPTGALSEAGEIDGRRTRTKIFAGEPILHQKLFEAGSAEQGADALIPKGYRVVSVRVDPVTIHGGLLLPGSRVDLQVYLNRNDANGVQQTTARTVLQNIKVFAVNDILSADTSNQDVKSIAGRTVSLLVTPAQAEKVTLASEMGTIRLIMRSPEDDVETHTRGAIPKDVFGGGLDSGNDDREQKSSNNKPSKGFAEYLNSIQASIASQQHTVAKPTMPVAQPTRFVMRLLRGNEVNDVEMQGTNSGGSGVPSGWKINGAPLPTPPQAADPGMPPIPGVPGADQDMPNQPKAGTAPSKDGKSGPVTLKSS